MRTENRVLDLVVVLVVVFLVTGGCSGGVDTAQDFAMKYNDGRYSVELTDPVAGISEQEAGLSGTYHFTITFPIKKLNAMNARGFVFHFDPEEVEEGAVMRAAAGDDSYKLNLQFHPLVGHRVNEGILLAYSSGIETGSLEVRFDTLEPKLDGRVKGTIIKAVLFGYFESADSMEPIKPKKPKKLEIFNFSFDTTFKPSMF
ncbi:MAG: hypothetical protein GY757_04755 [bacterium]|nr:hypothetical protein [bacterium]